MIAVAGQLLTAEQYAELPDNGQPTELVRGRVVAWNLPAPRHGEICIRTVRIVGRFLDDHDTGRLIGNDSDIIVARDPDTVRGGDVEYFSYERIPRGPVPAGYLSVVPELIFEVRSPGDRWSRILAKVADYLEAGVTIVCVLDQQTESCHVYRPDAPVQVLSADGELTLEVLPGFSTLVKRFFE